MPGSPQPALNQGFFRIILGHVFLHAAMAGTRMAAPLWALNHGFSGTQAGVLVALFSLTQIFFSLPAGRYADRHGLKRPVGWSILIATVGIAIAALWPSYPVLCASALLTGGSVGAAIIALQRHVGKMAADRAELKKLFSWMAIAPAVSNFVGPVVAGLAIDHVGFRAAFALMALMPFITWLHIRTARELITHAPSHEAKTTGWQLFNQPRFRRLMVLNWFFSASWDLHSFMVPLLGHERGMQASQIGTILGMFAIAAALIRLVIPWVAPHLKEWQMITTSIVITGLAICLYPFTYSAFTMGLCSALVGVALGAVQPMVLSMVHHITPHHRHGEALAIRAVMINLSSVTMPTAMGFVGGLIGISGVFWIMGAVLVVASPLGLSLRDRQGPSPP